MVDGPLIFCCGVLVPVEGPAMVGGAVAVMEGYVAGVGNLGEVRRRFAGAREVDLGHCVVVPGLVNGHTHLELSYVRAGDLPRGHFTEWVRALMNSYPAADNVEGTVREAVRAGVAASLAAGVTTVGDISRHCAVTRGELAKGPLRAVSYGEVVGLGKMRDKLEGMLAGATGGASEGRMRIGVSPHAPYTVEGPALARVVRQAVAYGLPMAMHLGELAEEAVFLRDLSGALGKDGDFLARLGILDERIATHAGGPFAWARDYGLLGAAEKVPMVLAHANYVTDEDLEMLAGSRAAVAYCPRTHAYFGHGPHRFREMMVRGINVCLGTDSLASNPDLSVLGEARFLGERFGDLRPEDLLRMVTLNGARALGMGDVVGSLVVGKRADLAAFVVGAEEMRTAERAVEAVIRGGGEVEAVFIDGLQVIMPQ